MEGASASSNAQGAAAPPDGARDGKTINQHVAEAPPIGGSLAREGEGRTDGNGSGGGVAATSGGDGEEASQENTAEAEADGNRTASNATAEATSSQSRKAEGQVGEGERKESTNAEKTTVALTSDNGDVTMADASAPSRKDKERNFFALLSAVLTAEGSTDDLERQGRELAAEYFTSVYNTMTRRGATPKAATELPETTSHQQEQLFVLLKTLITDKRSTMQRVNAAISDLVVACFRSSWTLDQLLSDRVAKAQIHSGPPNTAWGTTAATAAAKTVQDRLAADMEVFRFDTTVYTAEEVQRLRAVCTASHGFAEKPRQGTDDEWKIIWGIVNGSILMRVLPQFLKRCCTLEQFQWLHHFMVVNAEGELYARLPPKANVFDYNQTSKRLADNIRASVIPQKWTDARVEAMLQNVKVVSYNKEMHALHFHFYTKQDAIQWENMPLPFHNVKLELKNPDARYREVIIQKDGTEVITHKRPSDGAQDDRYQAPYKFRLTNVTRTTEIDKVAAYLQRLTNNGLRIGVPIDPYGQGSDWSLTWEFFATKASCPPALENINRLLWREHAFLIIHRPGVANAPCHKCARVGHKEAECPTPESDWLTECTIVVTEPDIASIQTERSSWKSAEEAKKIFDRLGKSTSTATATAAADAPANRPPVEVAQGESSDAPKEAPVAKDTPMHQKTPLEQAASAWKTVMTRNQRKKGGSVEIKKAPSKRSAAKTRQRGKGVASTKTPKKEDDVIVIESDEEMKEADENEDDYNDGDEEGTTGREAEPKDAAEQGRGQLLDVAGEDARKDKSGKSVGQTDATSEAELQNDDQALIDAAVQEANMERFGTALEAAGKHHRTHVDLAAIHAHLVKKLPDRGEKASRAWLLEASGGRLADTPSHGNCQFHSIIEAMLQRAIKETQDDAIIVELTMLLKYGLQMASLVDGDKELRASKIASLPDNVATDPDSIRAYYAQLAISSSAPSSLLPQHLWGGTDTLRMAAKLLRRRIDVIVDSSDPTNVNVMQFVPQKVRDRATKKLYNSATPHGLDQEEWLNTIKKDLEHGVVPIVIHLSTVGKHYSSVLFHRETITPPEKHQTDMRTHLNRTQEPPPASKTIPSSTLGPQITSTFTSDGPTRVELIGSQSEIDVHTALKALVQNNWTTNEKKIVIDCLVQDPKSLKEMLTFCAGGSQGSEASIQLAQQTQSSGVDAVDSDSSYTPSSDEEDAEEEAPYAFPSPETGANYPAWAAKRWKEVQTRWAEQDGVKLPGLGNHKKLEEFASKHPEEMASAGALFASPFVLLAHFEDPGIRAWMTDRWRNAYLALVRNQLEEIKAPSERTIVEQWMDQLAHTSHLPPSAKLRLWTNAKALRIIKTRIVWRRWRRDQTQATRRSCACMQARSCV